MSKSLLECVLIDEIRARDKRGSAYHEAGHAAVALALGGRGVRAYLIPHNPADPRLERTWTGRVEYGLNSCSPKERAVFAVAGAVAEAVVTDEWEEGWGEYLCSEELSDSDAAGIGDCDPEAVAQEAHAILQKRWAKVVLIAEALIQEEYLTDGEVLSLWNGGKLWWKEA